MYDQLDNLNITIDKSVKSITRAACMYLSLAIEYGILLTENPTARIVIYDDHIDFGVSMNPMMDMIKRRPAAPLLQGEQPGGVPLHRRCQMRGE